MDHGAIARRLLRRRSDLEKNAFLVGAARRAGNFAMRAAKNDPLSTALTVGGTVAFGPTLLEESMKPDPASQQRAMERRLLAQQMKGSPMKVKVGSVVSREEVLEGLAIRRGLEKAASRSRTFSNVFKGMSLPKMFAAGAALSAGAATAGAGSMGVSTAIGKGQEALHKSKRDKHFSDMLKADPSLKTSPKAKAFFNVLHQASPFIATEPHVAAATVRSMIEAPEGYALHPKFMKDVLDIEEKRQKTRYPGLRAPTLRGEMPDLD